MRSVKLDLNKLQKWIGGDPFREALLIDEVPTKHSTITRILNGNYEPSERMANRFNLIMSRYPNGDPTRARKEPIEEAG